MWGDLMWCDVVRCTAIKRGAALFILIMETCIYLDNRLVYTRYKLFGHRLRQKTTVDARTRYVLVEYPVSQLVLASRPINSKHSAVCACKSALLVHPCT